jgi:hypothetical protein
MSEEEILETDKVTNEETDEITKEGTKGENKFEQCILKKNINDKIYYQCKFCDFISNLKSTLKKHLEKKNKCYNTDSAECKYCRKKFRDKSNLKKHLEKQNKCYSNSDLPIKIVMENNKGFKIEKLELNEEKLKKQILDNEKEIKRLKDSLSQQKEEIQENKKRYEERVSDMYHTFFESYINKFANLDLMFFTGNFIRNNRYDTKVMEYYNFIISIFDKSNTDKLDNLLEDIEKYNKQNNFESLFKKYQKELELRNKTTDTKKLKYTPIQIQLNHINTFINKHYKNE